MNRDKMKEIAQKMKQAEAHKDKAILENAGLVREGLLTREEATKCIAGTMLKAADELGLQATAAQGDLGYIRLLLDQKLDGADFAGLQVGLHI